MKKSQVITVLILLGAIYFLVNLWLQDPFSSKASVPMKADALDYADFSESDTRLTDIDDTILEKDIEQLDTEFQLSIKESQKVLLASSADENIKEAHTESSTLSPWTIVDRSHLPENTRLREDIEPLQLVQINSKALQTLAKGDQLNFPINNQQLVVTVLSNKTLWNGDVSIQGTIEGDDGSTFPAVISSGKNATFASFSTAQGSFELEAFGDIGGLYSVTDMDKQAFYPKTDELLN